jgi:CheY-like chemotaxis protein
MMSFRGQIKCCRQSAFVSINAYVPDGAGLTLPAKKGWQSTRTSDTPQWTSDHERYAEDPGRQKQQVTGQDSGQRIVLHIDDDEEDRMVLEEALQKLDPGIKVQQVDNGRAALFLLKQSKELGNLPCLIILDINMPGMNGTEVLTEIKKDRELASLPLILFTTSSGWTYRDLIKKENVEFITKPLTPSELSDTARKMLKHCLPH